MDIINRLTQASKEQIVNKGLDTLTQISGNNTIMRKNIICRAREHFLSKVSHPTRMIFEPISICNYACDKCLYSTMKRKREPADLKKYTDFLVRWKEQYGSFIGIEFAGAGEVLMYKDFAELVRTTHDIMPCTNLVTTSNIALLTPLLARELIYVGLTEWQISLDSVNVREYKEIVGRDVNVVDILQNIKMLWETMREIEEVDSHRCKLVILAHRPYDGEYNTKMMEIENAVKGSCDVVSKSPYQSLNSRKKEPEYNLSEKQLFNKDFRIPCNYIWNDLAVIGNGDVRVCCADMFDSPISFGNVFNDSIEDIINNKNRREYKEKMLSNDWDGLYLCKACHNPRQ